jgi:hypothetical protein
VVPAYEEEVRGLDRVLREADEFFMQRGRVYDTLRALARRLDEAGIPYAVLGAIGMGEHGMRRLTLDIDILLTAEACRNLRRVTWDADTCRPSLARGSPSEPPIRVSVSRLSLRESTRGMDVRSRWCSPTPRTRPWKWAAFA